jgi:hypothetical protein
MDKSISRLIMAATVAATMSVSVGAQAKETEVKITKDKSYSTVYVDNELVKISRIQDTSHVIKY